MPLGRRHYMRKRISLTATRCISAEFPSATRVKTTHHGVGVQFTEREVENKVGTSRLKYSSVVIEMIIISNDSHLPSRKSNPVSRKPR